MATNSPRPMDTLDNGAIVITSRTTGGKTYVLCMWHPDSPEYVTWLFDKGEYFHGWYHRTLTDAVAGLARRGK